MDKQQASREVLMEFARKLGTLIRDSAEMKAMKAAEQAYDQCGELQAKVTEYYVNQKAATETKDEEIGVIIRRRMDELYAEMEAHPVFAEYMRTQNAVQELMNAVNDQIQLSINGDSGCTPEKCATCKGCSTPKTEEKESK